MAAAPYGPLKPLMKPWNWWGGADRHSPFGQVQSFFYASVVCLCQICEFWCVCLCENESEGKREGEEIVCVYVPAAVCVQDEQSSDELPSLDRGFWLAPPSEILLLCWLTMLIPQHHNSQSSSKKLADPNGNVISRIKDGPALMRGELWEVYNKRTISNQFWSQFKSAEWRHTLSWTNWKDHS